MKSINQKELQAWIDQFAGQEVYIHLETTNGSYATHHDASVFTSGAFIRNAKITYDYGKVAGEGPYRVGLKIKDGWVYGNGLTHAQLEEEDRLLIAGHDFDGKLAVALQISRIPFE